ncbi:MAG: phage terminase large subunit family protein, partial [Phycisphaerales bacterium]
MTTGSYRTIDPCTLTAEEVAILDPPPVPPMVEWAEENLILPKKETRLAGLMNFDFSPWMRDLCNWFADPDVREITLLGPLQFGKTLFISACLAYAIRWMPMPTMLVMANHQSLNKRMKRLRALFEANEFLMDQLDGSIKNLNIGEATELKDLLLVLAWVTSDAALAESPEGIIFA